MTAALVAACGGAAPDDIVTRSDSAGVVLAVGSATDLPAPVTLVEELRLAGENRPPQEVFHQVSAVGTDASGNIHILDGPAHRIITFDSTGRHLRTVGRRGGGPGEINHPLGLLVADDGTIGVMDMGKRGVVRFGPDGAVLPVHPLPASYRGGRVDLRGDVLLTTVSHPAANGGMTTSLRRAALRDTVDLVQLPMPVVNRVELASCGMTFTGMPPVFSPTLRWAMQGGRLAVASAAEYDIQVFDDASARMRIRRRIPPTPATMAMAVAEQGEGLRVSTEAGLVVCDPREVVDQLGIAPAVPAIAAIQVAPDGSIWVQRGGLRGEPRAVDLFSPDGDYRGTLPPGSPFPAAFIGTRRILVAERDAMDVVRLVVYRLSEGAG